MEEEYFKYFAIGLSFLLVFTYFIAVYLSYELDRYKKFIRKTKQCDKFEEWRINDR